jgi:RNA polymerase sigma-70 factor (ECF subfamily)
LLLTCPESDTVPPDDAGVFVDDGAPAFVDFAHAAAARVRTAPNTAKRTHTSRMRASHLCAEVFRSTDEGDEEIAAYDDAAIPSRGERVSPMWSVSDEALLAGLASGESDAAVAFVRRFQRRVFGLALSILGDPAASEDVAQETFARAWRHAGAYDPRRGPVATWLLSIARNLAIDSLRMRRADPVDPETIVSLQPPAHERGPEERALEHDDAQRLYVAITQLPPEQRRALLMAAFQGRTAREIGEIDDVPLGTAKTRIRAAMLKLRAALQVEDDERGV